MADFVQSAQKDSLQDFKVYKLSFNHSGKEQRK